MHAAKPAAVFGHARWGWNAQYVLPYRIQRLQPDTCSNTKKNSGPSRCVSQISLRLLYGECCFRRTVKNSSPCHILRDERLRTRCKGDALSLFTAAMHCSSFTERPSRKTPPAPKPGLPPRTWRAARVATRRRRTCTGR